MPPADFNAAIRSAGNRSRALPDIPDIGQNAGIRPAPQAGFPPPPPQPTPPAAGFGGQPFQAPAPTANPAAPPNQGVMTSPMRAPAVNPQTFTIHPPGSDADRNQYNYEPQPDGSWRVYPPGVAAPAHTASASLPRAASTGDYLRMARAFGTANPLVPAPGIPSHPGPTPRAPGF